MDPYGRTSAFDSSRFLIPDIVDLICEAANENQSRQILLSVLARTSRVFYDAAFVLLWSELDNVAPLIRCLPADAWKMRGPLWGSKKIHLTRPILPSDMPRMHFHARLVKKFVFEADPQPQVDPDTLDDIARALQDANIQVLLPNINEVSWSHMTMSDREFAFLPLFLGPNIQKLSISLSGIARSRSNSALRAGIIHKLNLPALCPSLRELHVEPGPEYTSATIHHAASVSALSHVVQRWSHLHTLLIPNLTPEAFAHVARLPQLRLLILTHIGTASPIKFAGHPLMSSLSKSVCLFPALREVYVKCGHVNIGTAVLGAVLYAPKLVRLQLEVEARATTEHANNLLRVISTAYTPWHESLELLILSPASRKAESATTPAVDLLTIHAVRPLFIFANLSVVILSLADGFDLVDEELYEIGKAWPRLVVLDLHETMRRVTLKGVMMLGQCCPSLNKLSIEFDGSTEALAAARLLGEGAMNDSLVTLEAGKSPIGDVDEMADVLAKAFPNLASIMGATVQWLTVHLKSKGWSLQGTE